MKILRPCRPTLLIALLSTAASVGCRDRSRVKNEASAGVPGPQQTSARNEAKIPLRPGEEALNKLLTALLTGEGRPIDVENELAGRNLVALRKLAAEKMTPEGLPVFVIIGGRKVEGYFELNEGILEKALPESAKPFIIGVEGEADAYSIEINLDHNFMYYLKRDSFFLGFGTFKH